MNKKKIFFLNDMISPYKVPVYEELSKRYDLEVNFCKAKTKDRLWDTSLKRYNFKWKILPEIDLGPIFFNFTLLFKLLFSKYDAYLIGELPEAFLSIWTTIIIAKIKNKPIIILSGAIKNEVNHPFFNKRGIIKILRIFAEKVNKTNRKLIYKNANSFISYGKYSTEYLLSNQVNENKIFSGSQILPKITLSKPNKKIKNNKINLLYLGYLKKDKGIRYLIEAFKKIKNNQISLNIVGSGEYEQELKELSKEDKRISFIGYKEGVDKANLYYNSDLFIFPTLYDCWGLVVNEAFYYGLPVISTDKAGAIELIEEGKTGLIVPDKNVDALAKAIKKLLGNPKLLSQMKKNVKKIPKSKIVDVNTAVNTFDKAIKYALNTKNATNTNTNAKK